MTMTSMKMRMMKVRTYGFQIVGTIHMFLMPASKSTDEDDDDDDDEAAPPAKKLKSDE